MQYCNACPCLPRACFSVGLRPNAAQCGTTHPTARTQRPGWEARWGSEEATRTGEDNTPSAGTIAVEGDVHPAYAGRGRVLIPLRGLTGWRAQNMIGVPVSWLAVPADCPCIKSMVDAPVWGRRPARCPHLLSRLRSPLLRFPCSFGLSVQLVAPLSSTPTCSCSLARSGLSVSTSRRGCSLRVKKRKAYVCPSSSVVI